MPQCAGYTDQSSRPNTAALLPAAKWQPGAAVDWLPSGGGEQGLVGRHWTLVRHDLTVCRPHQLDGLQQAGSLWENQMLTLTQEVQPESTHTTASAADLFRGSPCMCGHRRLQRLAAAG